jgi:gliding motility-associated-like protein
MATLNVQVVAAGIVILAPQGPFCETDPATTLPTVQNGITGNWSGSGVSANVFTPAAAGVGGAFLTFTPDPGQCANPANLTVQVTSAITPTLIPQGPFCETDPAVPLLPVQSGISGTWSGSGVVGGIFDPSSALPGSNTVTFTPDPGQCANPNTLNITVELAVPPTPPALGPFCSEQAPTPLPTNVSGIDGMWSGSGVVAGVFDPASAFLGPNTITFTPLFGECALPVTTDVFVEPQPSIDPLVDQQACGNFVLPPITGSNLTGGEAYYTGSFGSGTVFSPGETVTAGGTYFIYDEVAGCFDEQSFELTLNDPPMLSCGEDTPASSSTANDGFAFINITGGTAPYTVEIDGPVFNDVLTTSNNNNTLGGVGQGAYNITVTDANGCVATCTFTITAPDCNLDFNFDVQDASCPNAADGSVDLTVSNGQTPYDYLWSNMATAPSISGLAPGTYFVTVTDGASCQSVDSVVVGSLSPLPTVAVAIPSDTICESGCLTYELTFTGTPPFELNYTLRSDTDTVMLSLMTMALDTTLEICPVDTLENTFDSLFVHFGLLVDANCQDTVDLLDTVPFFPIPVDTLSPTLCPGESLMVGSSIYDASNPMGIDTLLGASANGCDSIVVVELDFYTIDTTFFNDALCTGQSITVNGMIYDETNPSGIEIIAGGASTGCDSIISVDLSFGGAAVNNLNETLCPGESLTVNGTLYDETMPMGSDTIPGGSVAGCDSIINVSLTFFSLDTTFVNDALCTGQSITVNGTIYDETNPSGIEIIAGGASTGCDSIISVDLSFGGAAVNNLNEMLCPGESLTVNGTLYDETMPMGSDTIPGGSVAGCDSIINVSLTFFSLDTTFVNDALCTGQSITVNGTIYDETNPSGIEIIAGGASTSCDSIISVDLSFDGAAVNNIIETICFGESITVNGTTYDQSMPSGSELIPNGAVGGCDSIINVSLTFFNADTTFFTGEFCSGESLTLNGTVYDENNPSGIDIIPNGAANGCDSIISVNFQFTGDVVNNINDTLCSGEEIFVNGAVYNESNPIGTETILNASVDGCDSIVNVNLSFIPLDTAFITQSLCIGESLLVNGVVYDEANTSGIEVIPGAASTGCDSIVAVDLSFAPPAVNMISETLCPGESLTLNGVTYDELTPVGSDTLVNGAVTGCDSIINVSLTFLELDTTFVNDQLCFGESLMVNGAIYDESNPSGLEVVAGGAVTGCDSIVVVDLSFAPPAVNTITETLCPGESLTVNGVTYDELTPVGSDTLASGAITGCDSIVNVSLTFLELDTTFVNGQLCVGESLTVNGTLYNETNPSGLEVIAGAAASGCDSIVSVDLSFNTAAVNSISETLCPGESMVVNGVTYDELTPIGSDTLVNGAVTGCDSIINVSLTFLELDTTFVNSQLCIGESLTVNGTVYDEANPSGLEVIAGGSATGCDSIVSVDLQFLEAVEETLSLDLCEGEEVTVNGTLYNADNPAGTEVFPSGAVNGCDSVVVVELSFAPVPTASLEGPAAICSGEPAVLTFNLSGGDAFDVTLSDENGVVETFDGVQDGFTFTVTPDETTTYEITALATVINFCPPDLGAPLTIAVSDVEAEALVASDYDGFGVSCAGSSDGSLQGSAQNGQAPYTYAWSSGGSGESIAGLPAGSYVLTVTDAAGCTATDTVVLSEPMPIVLKASALQPDCFDDASGAIELDAPTGGTGPFEYSLDGVFFTAIPSFPITIPGLAPGSYTLTIQDVNDCTTETELIIPEAQPLVLELGSDTTINLGDNYVLRPQANFIIENFSWMPDSLQGTMPQVSPTETTVYRFTAVDSNGCSVTDELTVFIARLRDIYAPNAFSPNGDGRNDNFTLFGGAGAQQIDKLAIFDRWGDQLFETGPIPLNQPDLGWDGTFKGEEMNPGVYVFYAEVRFLDGLTEVVKGEVLLMR